MADKLTTGRKLAAHSRNNATKHGVLSPTPVVGPLETLEDWTKYRRAMLKSLGASGGLEKALAERIASLLWRLRRLERFETALLELDQAEAAHQAAHPEEGSAFAAFQASIASDAVNDFKSSRLQVNAMLPKSADLDKITRYESHLSRQLFATLRELESLQAPKIKKLLENSDVFLKEKDLKRPENEQET